MRVGRDARECPITLSDPLVSSVHAMLKLENGNLYVRDEGSSNGTFVNGAPIVARTLNLVPNGASLRFGPVEFSVRLD
jgi:pSer/pThr/pTyr-binding forkhead associated (FHA) protein